MTLRYAAELVMWGGVYVALGTGTRWVIVRVEHALRLRGTR